MPDEQRGDESLLPTWRDLWNPSLSVEDRQERRQLLLDGFRDNARVVAAARAGVDPSGAATKRGEDLQTVLSEARQRDPRLASELAAILEHYQLSL
jgi:hypothetical protein